MTKFLIAAFAVLLSAFAAQAASITSYNGAMIVEGAIAEGDDVRFFRVYEQMRIAGKAPKHVLLASPGGNVVAGAKLAQQVRILGMITAVADGDTCASICVLVWAAGHERIFTPHAMIGVHSVANGASAEANGDDGETLDAMGGTLLIARAMVEMGVPQGVVIKMIMTPPGEIAWLNGDDVAGWATLVRTD